MNDRFAELITTLNNRFDYVLIDCALVLAVTDAVIVGKLAGTTLMVLKHGRHPMAEIEACHQRLLQAGVADIGSSGALYGSRYGQAAYRYEYRLKGKGQ